MLGDRLADMFDMHFDLEESAGSLDPMVRRYIPIAAATCIELLYRQMGQRRFDPRSSMYTPINMSITLAEWDEFLRIIPMLGHADIFWHNRGIQSVDDIVSVLDELGMDSAFKGDPKLRDSTYRMYIVRNDYAHGRGTLRYDPREIVWTVRRHIEKALEQMPPLIAVFLLHGAKRAQMRGDAEAADALYRRAGEVADAADADPSARHVIAGKAA